MFPLDISLDQRIFQLERDDAVLAFLFGQRLAAGDIPGWSIGEAVMPDFSGADEVVEGGDYFFDRSDSIPNVQPIQIDVIDLQPPQRPLDRPVNILAAVASGVGCASFSSSPHPHSVPNVMVPGHNGLTRRPEPASIAKNACATD